MYKKSERSLLRDDLRISSSSSCRRLLPEAMLITKESFCSSSSGRSLRTTMPRSWASRPCKRSTKHRQLEAADQIRIPSRRADMNTDLLLDGEVDYGGLCTNLRCVMRVGQLGGDVETELRAVLHLFISQLQQQPATWERVPQPIHTADSELTPI